MTEVNVGQSSQKCLSEFISVVWASVAELEIKHQLGQRLEHDRLRSDCFLSCLLFSESRDRLNRCPKTISGLGLSFDHRRSGAANVCLIQEKKRIDRHQVFSSKAPFVVSPIFYVRLDDGKAKSIDKLILDEQVYRVRAVKL